MPRLLCVTAHPDDEAGNFGGTLAGLGGQGVQIRLICLTGGEAARNRGPAANAAELIQLRAGELAASCKILGIDRHEIWNLPDSGLTRVDFHQTASRLAQQVREWRPDLLFAMGPEGGLTGHPDHGMAGLLATAAFHWAASERCVPAAQAPVFQCPWLLYGSGRQPLPASPAVQLSPPDLACDIGPWVERKRAAFHCHHTQAPLFPRFDAYLAHGGAREYYHFAAAPPHRERPAGVVTVSPPALFDRLGEAASPR